MPKTFLKWHIVSRILMKEPYDFPLLKQYTYNLEEETMSFINIINCITINKSYSNCDWKPNVVITSLPSSVLTVYISVSIINGVLFSSLLSCFFHLHIKSLFMQSFLESVSHLRFKLSCKITHQENNKELSYFLKVIL